MANDVPTPENMRKLRARTIARGTIWQQTYIRDFPPRPTAAEHEGGGLSADELASNPMEDLLAALGACLTRSVHANALAQEIPIRRIETTVEADFHQPAARWGTGRAAPAGLETISVTVRIDSEAPKEMLADLVRKTALWSPVANTLFNPVHLDVRLADDGAAASETR